MPKRKSTRKIVGDKPQPIKKTTMSDLEKLANGWQWVQTDSRTKVLRAPENITP